MIEFVCAGCGKAYSVRDDFAGRRAKCKACGADILVPQGSTMPAATAQDDGTSQAGKTPGPRIPMRIRRLMADAELVRAAFAGQGPIRIAAMQGDPPELYRIDYHIQSLARGKGGKPTPRDFHEAEIRLTSEYPRMSPKCRLLTPIFHPNIDPSTICVGDHWTAGERLADLIVRIGEMIAYQAYNIKSPLDGEAAMWADLHAAELPTDSRNLHELG